METNSKETFCWRRIAWRRIVVETNSSGDELLKTSSKEMNCLETKSRGTLAINSRPQRFSE